MKGGNTGRGLAKHRKSGRAPKSPKLRTAMRLDAEKDERRAPQREMAESVQHLFNIRNKPS